MYKLPFNLKLIFFFNFEDDFKYLHEKKFSVCAFTENIIYFTDLT